MNTLQHEVQTRHQTSHTRVALSSHKEHVRTAQEFAADLLQYISMFSSVHIHIHIYMYIYISITPVAQQLQTAN